ncbi:sphingoid long-chain base transporter RSB1 [Fusarium circinatum]|uniref:Sphingoid long-chain base transporter RSB1 n=1 Tax=Fusarium circinatum TaxID=48490 RepID=A0A8H5T6W1_FUSCI|nr:sphingoid long-chain base transporter RSB1 [Fusarium circinatum]
MQPTSPLPLNGTQAPEGPFFCLQNPEAGACVDDTGYYLYRIDLAPNAAFLAIFIASLLGFIVTWVFTRRGTAFNVAMILGLLCEIIGYSGRIASWYNRFDMNAFLTQICCLTMGPAFMAARLAFQVATILAFIACSVDFAIRTIYRQRRLGEAAFDQRPEIVKVRNSRRFKAFLCALSLSALCILWRSAFRVAELSEGWKGPLMGHQYMFVGFEGILIVVAVTVLNIFHPALCMKELLGMDDGGFKGIWGFRNRKNNSMTSEESVEDSDRKTPTSEAVAV